MRTHQHAVWANDDARRNALETILSDELGFRVHGNIHGECLLGPELRNLLGKFLALLLFPHIDGVHNHLVIALH